MSEQQEPHIGYVYFLWAKAVNRIKIGYAFHDPDRRFLALDIGSPVKLKRLALMRGPQSLELELHARFKKSRRKGEWFRCDADLMGFIASHARDWRELRREEAAASQVVADANYRVAQQEWQRHTQSEEYLGLSSWMNMPPLKAVDPASASGRKKPYQLPRYGPLQKLLDQIAAAEKAAGKPS